MDFLAEDSVLVPVPRRAPLPGKDALWPALHLSHALVLGKMGARVLPCLVRTSAVPRSPTTSPTNRPDPLQHRATLRVDRALFESPSRITLVDDIVTTGTTLIAAASRLREALPGTDVRAFALVRMVFSDPDFARLYDPCRGRISFDGTSVSRRP